jgi:hypothetical protein
MKLSLPPTSTLIRRLLWAVAVLHVLSLASNGIYHGLGVRDPFGGFTWLTIFFNVDKEKNLPTWFSSAILMLAACLVWQVGTQVKAVGGPFLRHWRGLAAVFAAMSLDEVAQAHEVASKSGLLQLGSASYLSWMVVAAPLVLGFAVAYLRFLGHLPPRVRWLIVVAGCVFVGGAMGMEVVGAFLGRDAMTGQMQPGLPYLRYLLAASAEELMEMLGVVIFVHAVGTHLERCRAQAGSATGASVPALRARTRPADHQTPVAM